MAGRLSRMSKALPKGGSALRYAQGYERPALIAGTPLKLIWRGQVRSKTLSQYDRAMTGNAGLSYAAWQLAKRGWHAMPTIRNARGSDLFVTNDDETIFFGVQSKALSKRAAVPLGKDGQALRSEWWIITLGAMSDQPICFILSNDDVRARASTDKGGQGGRWLEPSAFDREEFREAWHRLPTSKAEGLGSTLS